MPGMPGGERVLGTSACSIALRSAAFSMSFSQASWRSVLVRRSCGK
jgi:hypothetical protein